MKNLSRGLLAVSALALTTAVAEAKTFVYCSEASPEGFDPSPYTSGTTFDASGHPIYNRLTEFKKGTTEIEPGLAESWEVSGMARNTPSSCARASSSIRTTASPPPATSMPTT